MDDLGRALRRRFGHRGFRPGQERLVRAVLEGRDALGVLPTGGGKSLTYLLPAVLRGGLTVVVSPLISLMTDQVERALRVGLRAAALHTGVAPDAREHVLADARAGHLRLLYLAPERWTSPSLRRLVADVRPALVAIDEAHCIVQWGFDFRPAYLRLAHAGRRVGSPVLALTATATPSARRDIENILGLRHPTRVVGSFDRPNLRFEIRRVRTRRERWREVHELVRESPGATLVYAPTRPQTEALRAAFARRGVDAEAYHAGLRPDERARVQARFLTGGCPVVVATNAFGMGVDKADVRRVIHVSPPGSLEAYYQEAGRAGRDGTPADCVVLWSPADQALHMRFIDAAHPSPRRLAQAVRARSGAPPTGWARAARRWKGRRLSALDPAALERALERYGLNGPDTQRADPGWRRVAALRRRRARNRLEAVGAYLAERSCRRTRLLAYFGERASRGRGRCCDLCDRRRALPAAL